MGIIVNNIKPYHIMYNGIEATLYHNGIKIWPEGDPYNPLNLPANTVRVRTSDGQKPIKIRPDYYDTARLVPGTVDVYDVYKEGGNLQRLLEGSTNVIEVLGANTTGIGEMSYMFYGCSSLTSVPLFDTRRVYNMYAMFQGCSSLTSVPLFDIPIVNNMSFMFYDCINVQTGALALYNRATSRISPPSDHARTFYNCGSNTTMGAAELAQIPSDWK